ncbi:MAG: nucleotidyltransferase domain-containing protein [Bryobacterales bacterium]|nr:nucleotidyltransferase domain-containing protein [Bryobacterales bacterium]MDE0629821.1 nucleotidyltransferase domain-containing protein [Bryobacterales bacterium]
MPEGNESRRQPAGGLSGSTGMEPVTEELLGRMVRLIVNEVDPEKVILFGSRGRGDATPESDVDLVVIEAGAFDETRSRLREEARLYKVLAGVRVRKDILVYSAEDVDYWRDSLNYVLARALREGRVLYERP